MVTTIKRAGPPSDVAQRAEWNPIPDVVACMVPASVVVRCPAEDCKGYASYPIKVATDGSAHVFCQFCGFDEDVTLDGWTYGEWRWVSGGGKW